MASATLRPNITAVRRRSICGRQSSDSVPLNKSPLQRGGSERAPLTARFTASNLAPELTTIQTNPPRAELRTLF
jgi:hypothetical protein